MAHVHARLMIVGSGPAGYTAAIYAARAMLAPVLVSGFQPGGQLMITTDVENYPGFADVVQGPWLMEQMQKQAAHVGTTMISDHISKVDLGSHPFRLWGDGGDTYSCEALVIATGAQAKWLGIPSEHSFQGFGVSACATCDGFFFRNREVVVVGGGNSAVEESLYLANLASKVTLVHRRDSLKAEKILQDRLLKHPKVDVIWDSAVDEICGVLPGGEGIPGVTHVRLKNLKTGALSDVKTDGVFIAIGHKPSTDLFAGQVAMKDSGYIITKPNSTATNIPGVFAAGDVADDTYRQAVTAAGLGCMAALEAEKWLAAQESGRMAAE
jgi:thioredoxin reductase (NADPH)